MPRLLLLFTLVPFIELYLLIAVAEATSFWTTVAMVLVTGFLGAALAKREGLRMLQEYRQALAQGVMPETGVLEAVLVLVGGVLLVAPGVLTDVVGLLLLVPFSRRAVLPLLRHRVERAIARGTVRVTGAGFQRSAEASAPTAKTTRGWERLDARGQQREAEADVTETP